MLSSKKKSRQRSNGKRGKMTYLLRQTCEGWGWGGWGEWGGGGYKKFL